MMLSLIGEVLLQIRTIALECCETFLFVCMAVVLTIHTAKLIIAFLGREKVPVKMEKPGGNERVEVRKKRRDRTWMD
jgi:hypothetical protein